MIGRTGAANTKTPRPRRPCVGGGGGWPLQRAANTKSSLPPADPASVERAIGHYNRGEYEEFLAPPTLRRWSGVIGHYNRGEYEDFLAPPTLRRWSA